MFMYVPCACSTYGGQEKVLDALKRVIAWVLGTESRFLEEQLVS